MASEDRTWIVYVREPEEGTEHANGLAEEHHLHHQPFGDLIYQHRGRCYAEDLNPANRQRVTPQRRFRHKNT